MTNPGRSARRLSSERMVEVISAWRGPPEIRPGIDEAAGTLLPQTKERIHATVAVHRPRLADGCD